MTEFDKVIHPGGVGKVTASIHTTSLKGDITKTITVTTNDPENARIILQLKASVRVPIDVSPESISLDGRAGAIAPGEVSITAVEGAPFDIVSAMFTDQNFTASFVPVMETEAGKPAPKAPKAKAGTVASGSKAYKLTITPRSDLAIGRTSGTLTLATTHPKAPELLVRIFANVRGEIDAIPERVTLRLGASAPPNAKIQHVVVRKSSTDGPPLKILSVTSSVPEIKTALKTNTDGQEYDVEIRYDGPPLTRALSEKVTVKTDNPKQPTIEIVVYGMLDPQVSQSGVNVVPGPVQPGHDHAHPVQVTPKAPAPAKPIKPGS